MENNDNQRLSSAQKRMVALHEFSPASTAYVKSVAIKTRITSNKIIQDSIEKLFTVHPELRTEFKWVPKTSEYLRITAFESKIDVCFEVLQDEIDIADYITNSIPAMKLFSSPLIKCRCIQSQNLSAIVIHIHNIIADKETMGKVVNNLIKILNKENVCGSPLSYSDYVTLEEEYFSSAEYEVDELFWREKYQFLPPLTTLSVMPLSDATWKDTKTYTARHVFKEFENEMTKHISQTVEDLEITEFIYYLACTSLILHRYIGVDDFVIGVPIYIRDAPRHDTIDGLLQNTVHFRSPINQESTFRQHILQIANDWRLVEISSKYPIDSLAHWMLTTHTKNISSVCSIMFNYNARIPSEEEIRVPSKHAKMPLMINVLINHNHESGVFLEWAEELLDASIVQRIGDSIISLCTKHIPLDQRITDFEILSASELSLLRSFSSEYQPSPTSEVKMHIQFETHAKTFPNNIAVVCDNDSVTYAELNQMASRIAHYITSEINADILRSQPVILFSEKDTKAIAMLIGVWKSGGFFLPVSISNKKVLKDTADRFSPAAVIYHCSDEEYKTLLEANFACPIINIQTMLDYTYEGFLRSDTTSTNQNIAYALRTSGTTGVPKSFRISHRSLNIICNAWKIAYNLESYKMIVLQWVLFSFGVFMNDIVRALICVPGTLIICPDNRRLDIAYCRNTIKQHKVSFIEVTPHFASYLFENANTEDFSFIKVFILSSDVIHSHVFQKVKRSLKPDQRVVNGYGMTEATNDSTYFEGDVLPSTRSDTVPVGKPLPGISIHVCDPKTLLPSPVGTVGEVYISGETIASGEVKLVTLRNGRRVALKTGDTGCWLPSGNLEIMGRSDCVVKFRGFRISTAEIEEQIIKRIPGIHESCVNVLVDDTHDKMHYLCAYVVAESMHHQSDSTIRQILSNELPYYMVPDIIHFCERLPETIYGKIDKKAISISDDLESQQTNRDDESSNERTYSNTLRILKRLFAQAMDIRGTNFIRTNLTFQENGATSFILARFYKLIKTETSFQINISDLFSYSSIACLSEYIDKKYQLTFTDNFYITADSISTDEIAITGLGIRLPCGIESLVQLWEVLEEGQDIVNRFPGHRSRDVKACSKSIPGTVTYKGAFFDRIDQFDNEFFNVSSDEATFMSPEQRMFLQVATEALLESRNISEVNGLNIGVYLSTLEIGYSRLDFSRNKNNLAGLVPGMVGTRVAYQWNLKGPCFLVDTACSSSLMALKLASESIKRNECEGALVGGVNLCLFPDKLVNYGDAEMHSPDFCCRAFDENANGTVLGEGVLCLYIEKLSTAVAKGKHIYGIVKSVASASVGRGNGITAPSALSQETAIKAALKAANVDKRDLNYIETHGSGTKLGDSIEISALSSIFNEPREKRVKLGTSKSMFGNLDTASGFLSVIKVLASFQFNKIPPSVNFKNPNHHLNGTCLSVVNDVQSWKIDVYGRKVAGVNTFGMTGISCHTIISDYVSKDKQEIMDLAPLPLLFRGKSFNQIKRQAYHYDRLIKATIQKRHLNTLDGLCYVVATKLRELSDANLSHTDFRMSITVETTGQVLELLSLINLSEQSEDLVQLSKERDDIHILFPEITNVTTDTSYVKSFLYDDHIDTYEIFGECIENITPAFGVHMSMYEESRLWLEPTNKSKLHQESNSAALGRENTST